MTELPITKVIYFVRHGQSVDNAAPVFQALSSPLSPLGHRQAKDIAIRVSEISFEVIIASPVLRARQTGEIIAKKTAKPIKYSDLFVECIKPKSISGRPFTDKRAGQIWRQWQKSLFTPGMRVEDGESYDDIISRADKALALLNEQSEQTIVVITHGFFLRTVVARAIFGDLLSGEIFHKFQSSVGSENTGLTVLKYQDAFEEEPSWRLWTYNDHAHLDDVITK